MCALPLDNRMTEKEYLALERESEIKHEFIDGDVIAMVGASEDHVAIVSTLNFLLYGQLRERPCRVFASDMSVRIEATTNYTYPDVVVVCGERHFVEDEPIAMLLNPTVIVEVLSSSTEAYDRGKKFHEYQQIPSLQDYVLVAQTEPRIECFSRSDDNTWVLTTASGLDGAIAIPSLAVRLNLAEVYERVGF